jgi:hypothetical protein
MGGTRIPVDPGEYRAADDRDAPLTSAAVVVMVMLSYAAHCAE